MRRMSLDTIAGLPAHPRCYGARPRAASRRPVADEHVDVLLPIAVGDYVDFYS